VNPVIKAALQGIREGDVITSMNGQPTEKEVTNSQAHALLKEAGPTLRHGLKHNFAQFGREIRAPTNQFHRK
jgi:S1-C subfamily serine protease